VKKKIITTAPVIIAIISITLMSCGDDDGGVAPSPNPGNGGGEVPKTGYSRFMPLNNGNKWTYAYVHTDHNGPVGTDVYEMRIVDKFDNYHGFESYLVECSLEHEIPSVDYMVLGCDGDQCYRFTCPWWEYVVEDDMPWLGWSQAGLLFYTKLQFNSVKDVSVPAGTFKNCKQLQLIYEDDYYTYTYEECYAVDVGLVYAMRSYKHSSTNWHQYEYKLKSYTVNRP
jgi:hypothetical protein